MSIDIKGVTVKRVVTERVAVNMQSLLALFVWTMATVSSTGCTPGHYSASQIGEDHGFNQRVLDGQPFEHVVYESNLTRLDGGMLHVYIEGDGLPWRRGRVPADDPTPRKPLALRMMALDDSPALYLGRPCYFGLQNSRHCTPDVWTFGRYSAAVVSSMRSVIRRYEQELDLSGLVLVGYSGGGALATLLARDIDTPTFLVTVAANLDIDAWTTIRGYLPLTGSLNPVDFTDELHGIPQLHLIASGDEKVPPSVTRRYTDRLGAGASRLYEGFDHSCCWLDLWPRILEEAPWRSLGR